MDGSPPQSEYNTRTQVWELAVWAVELEAEARGLVRIGSKRSPEALEPLRTQVLRIQGNKEWAEPRATPRQLGPPLYCQSS